MVSLEGKSYLSMRNFFPSQCFNLKNGKNIKVQSSPQLSKGLRKKGLRASRAGVQFLGENDVNGALFFF